MLLRYNYEPVSRTGSHVTLQEELDTGDVRTVTVPMHSRLKVGTLRNLARQVGANDFGAFCRWIDENK